jgi:SpoVK/Ycf46/Vps4 family AAA+-type ATPase
LYLNLAEGTMLRSQLEDTAISAAKDYGHPVVEPRHVLFAAARHLRQKPEIEALLPRARAALEPRGTCIATPTLSPEAQAMLASISTTDDAAAALLNAFPPEAAAADTPKAASVGQSGAESATSPQRGSSAERVESVADVMADLNRLVGLTSVKRQIATVVAVVQANEERQKAGLPPLTPSLHLVFTGPPGTGKTTVARMVARLYAAAGALPGARFVEATRSDFVAEYVGQTAIKTNHLIAGARPGVLFIDEAYSLSPSHASDFGAEAIAALVKAMEDHRNELAVIAAGYVDEMSRFIGSNPGLKSRFKTYVDFPDYTPQELTNIFANFAGAASLEIGIGVLEAVEAVFRRAAEMHDYGNARFARSLFEHAYASMAARAAEDGVVKIDEISTITVVDVQWRDGSLDKRDRRIGFRDGIPPNG